MARITIYLPDDLRDDAELAGIDVAGVCRRALAYEIGRRRGGARSASDAPDRARQRADDTRRFQRGMELGLGWARTASAEEIEEVAAWNGSRWRQFKVTVAHSLATAYCRDTGLGAPPPGEDFWFERDAYTLGMVHGVAAARERQLRV